MYGMWDKPDYRAAYFRSVVCTREHAAWNTQEQVCIANGITRLKGELALPPVRPTSGPHLWVPTVRHGAPEVRPLSSSSYPHGEATLIVMVPWPPRAPNLISWNSLRECPQLLPTSAVAGL